MHLCPATINQLAARVVDLLDQVDQAVDLGIGRVQVIVVDVEPRSIGNRSSKGWCDSLGSSIGVARSLEGNIHEALSLSEPDG